MQKNERNIWLIQKIVVPLHPQNKEDALRSIQINIAEWSSW